MNKKLKGLRLSNLLSQEELAKKVKVSIVTYNKIEQGKISGSIRFWKRIQNEFNINDNDMWNLINNQNNKEV